MRKTPLLIALIVLCCLAADAQPLSARPKKVKHGAMDFCELDGGKRVEKDGAEVCCARECKGAEEAGHCSGRFRCVQCIPPGSDNCEEWYEGERPVNPALVAALEEIRAGNEGALQEQQRVRAEVGQVLAALDTLQRRIETMQATCGPADLLPVPRAGSSDFCRTDQQGNLVVRVSNRGSTGASASTLYVTFSTNSGPARVELPTPAMAANGSSVDVATPLPANCLSAAAGCAFQIAVDAGDAVFESDEGNNGASGSCKLAE